MRWRVLAVAFVAVTAGCGSVVGLGGNPAGETVTPAPVPTPPPTPSDPRVGVAPGVDATGVFDVDYLVRHHVSAVVGTSYVWESHHRQSYSARNATVWINNSHRIVVENATTYRRHSSSIERYIQGQREFLQDYRVYADGERRYARWLQLGEPDIVYRTGPVSNASRQFASLPMGRLRQYMDFENQSVERLRSVGDRTHYRISGTRSNLGQYGEVRNYTASAIVREDGFVRSISVSFETTRANQNVTITYSSEYSQTGTTTVSEPAWVANVRSRVADG